MQPLTRERLLFVRVSGLVAVMLTNFHNTIFTNKIFRREIKHQQLMLVLPLGVKIFFVRIVVGHYYKTICFLLYIFILWRWKASSFAWLTASLFHFLFYFSLFRCVLASLSEVMCVRWSVTFKSQNLRLKTASIYSLTHSFIHSFICSFIQKKTIH